MSEREPLSVACPHCGVGRGERCERPDGEPAKSTHARRVAKAKDEAATRAAAVADVPDRIEEERWRRLYRTCRLELEQAAGWTVLASEQLEAMVLNMAEASKARAGAAREPVVEGSTKQKVPNKLWATALHLDAQALYFAKALKLTPDTRGTSAPQTGDGGADEGKEPEARDELADLDDLAQRRRAAQSKRRRRR